MSVDQWLLAYIRDLEAVSETVGTQVFLYRVPGLTALPYLHLQLISGEREAKTQTYRNAGNTRFQIDLYCEDRYAGRSAVETIMAALLLSQTRSGGLVIEQTEVAGPRMLSSEEGFRFSFDLLLYWVQEE
jgi:hypothetical protein